MKSSHLCLMLVGAVVSIAGARAALYAQESALREATRSYATSSARDDADEKSKHRLREGTELTDQAGRFRQEGDGAIFVSESDHELVALPNLNLERVVRTLKGSDEAESIRWHVNGVVTEFNGRNYLLIQRAVYKSASPPPLPEQITN
jgi:hypothetical protein